MYRSFSTLAVRDENDLRRPARIRKLFLLYYGGTLAVAASCVALGLAGTVLAAAVWRGLPPGLERLAAAAAVSLLCALCAGMGVVFFKAATDSPLYRYPSAPGDYEFARGRLTEAFFPPGKSRSASCARVTGDYEGGGTIIPVEFQASLWSEFVMEAGEEKLKPEDDRYSQKGKRRRLPLEAFVIYRRDTPLIGELAGLSL